MRAVKKADSKIDQLKINSDNEINKIREESKKELAEIKTKSKLELEKNEKNAINNCAIQFMENCIKNPQEGFENFKQLKKFHKM